MNKTEKQKKKEKKAYLRKIRAFTLALFSSLTQHDFVKMRWYCYFFVADDLKGKKKFCLRFFYFS